MYIHIHTTKEENMEGARGDTTMRHSRPGSGKSGAHLASEFVIGVHLAAGEAVFYLNRGFGWVKVLRHDTGGG